MAVQEIEISHALSAQRAAEDWLDQLMEADDTSELPEGGEMFCGCTTCIVREVLESATPELWQCFVEIVREHGVEISPDLQLIFEND